MSSTSPTVRSTLPTCAITCARRVRSAGLSMPPSAVVPLGAALAVAVAGAVPAAVARAVAVAVAFAVGPVTVAWLVAVALAFALPPGAGVCAHAAPAAAIDAAKR